MSNITVLKKDFTFIKKNSPDVPPSPVSILRRPNPTAAPVPLAVADDRFNRLDRIPPQTVATMEGVAQLLIDGLAGSPLLGASPSPVPDRASAWRPLGAAASAGVLCGRAGWGPSGGARVRSWRGLAGAGRGLRLVDMFM